MDAVHGRLAGDLLAVGAPYGLVLAGGEAVRAHGLVEARVSEGVDLATEHPADMAEIARAVRAGLEGRGWAVEAPVVDPLAARLVVADEASGARWRVDLRKEGAVAAAGDDRGRSGAGAGGPGRYAGAGAGGPGAAA